MRIAAEVFVALTLLPLWSQDLPPSAVVGAKSDSSTQPSSLAGTVGSGAAIVPGPPSKSDLAKAKKEFAAGKHLESAGQTEAAFDKFKQASQLSPRNVEYATAREFTRQRLVMAAIDRGNKALLANNEVGAEADFEQALEFDPTNDFARQRLHDAIWEQSPAPSRKLQVVQKSIEVALSPDATPKDFHFRGDSRTLLTQIARAYGITATIDDSVKTRLVRFDIEHVTFAEAMGAATQVTKSFWIALSGSQMYLVSDTPENRRNFERLAIRTFYLPDLMTPQELTEIVNALRVILDIKFVLQDASESTITIRAPLPVVEAASQMIESLVGGRPQVMLDVRVYEISSSLVRQLGMQLPSQFNIFNISPSLIASLGVGAQDLINQLIASGGINQANSQGIQALLAQLSQSTQNPIFSTPFATFGGGLTLTGVSGTPPITANLQVNESDVKSLEHVELLASQNTPALMRIGERYPIVNATFAPIYNSTAISQVLGNNSYIAPFPSFNFEDLGLNLKATPIIHSNADVSLKIDMNIRTLGDQTVNGIPIILNQEYVGSITLKNEESGVVAGLISKSDANSLAGYPFLSRVPGLSYASSLHSKNVNNDELLVVMTPHIVRMAPSEGFAIQLPVGH